jgi:hypothetical protein
MAQMNRDESIGLCYQHFVILQWCIGGDNEISAYLPINRAVIDCHSIRQERKWIDQKICHGGSLERRRSLGQRMQNGSGRGVSIIREINFVAFNLSLDDPD